VEPRKSESKIPEKEIREYGTGAIKFNSRSKINGGKKKK